MLVVKLPPSPKKMGFVLLSSFPYLISFLSVCCFYFFFLMFDFWSLFLSRCIFCCSKNSPLWNVAFKLLKLRKCLFFYWTQLAFGLLSSTLVIETCLVTKYCSDESEISDACWRRHTLKHWVSASVTKETGNFLFRKSQHLFFFLFFFLQMKITEFCIWI